MTNEFMTDDEHAQERKDAELRRIGLLYVIHKIDKAEFERRWAVVEKKPLGDFMYEARDDKS